MAWNYEKSCDEPDAYKYGEGIYTPPAWSIGSKGFMQKVMYWEQAEARAVAYRNSTYADTYKANAINCWGALERAMTWEDASKIPEFRRQYIEWLAKKKDVDYQMGFQDVSEDSLPILQRIIAVGYRQLAKTAHPDLGGTVEDFNNLKTAKNQLDLVLKSLEDVL